MQEHEIQRNPGMPPAPVESGEGSMMLADAGVCALFAASGAAALVYQVVWTRMMILVFGSTSLAVSSILTAFMAGLAAGSYAAGRKAGLIRRPLLAYGAIEICIGLTALSVPLLVPAVGILQKAVWDAFHPPFLIQSVVRFVLACALLLMPTALMGATLPVLARRYAGRGGRQGFRLGILYAANTSGAVAGAALSGFVLLPALGVEATVRAAAAASIAVGVAAAVLGARRAGRQAPAVAASDSGGARRGAPEPASPVRLPFPVPYGLAAAVFASGFASMTLEVVWSRILGLLVGSSVYAFSMVLAIFLSGLAARAAALLKTRLGERPARLLVPAFAVASLAVFASMLAIGELPRLFLKWAKRPGIETPRGLMEEFIVSKGWATPEQIGEAVAAADSDEFREPSEPALSVADALRQAGVIGESQQRDAGIHVKRVSAGRTYNRFLAGQVIMAFAVLFAPVFFMGMVFPLALASAAGGAAGPAAGAGRLYAWNTLGCIIGSFSGGFVLVPLVGAAASVSLMAALYMAFVFAAAAKAARSGPSPASVGAAIAAALACAALPLLSPKWDGLVMSCGIYQYAFRDRIPDGSRESFDREFVAGNRLLFYKDGLTTTVTVVEEKSGNVFMATNGKTDASSRADLSTQVLLGQIPMALAPCRDDVCIIGYASGVTVGSVLTHPVRRAVAVEIEPAVVEASRFFDGVNGRPLDDPRLMVATDDGRIYLALSGRKFDVIVSEPSNPWMTIASNLFTGEFFRIGKERLKPKGLFCQWIQLYCLDTVNLRSLIATFKSVFGHVSIFYTKEMVDMLLIGSDERVFLDAAEIRRRVEEKEVASDLDRVGVSSAADLLSRFIIGPDEVAAFSAGANLNTDDNALVEFSSPKTLFTSFHVEIQQMMIEASAGISKYMKDSGEDARARAGFLAEIAESAMSQSDSLEGLARRFAQDSADLDPQGRGKLILDALSSGEN